MGWVGGPDPIEWGRGPENPLSEKLSENGIGYSGFSIFLPTYSRKYSLSKIMKIFSDFSRVI